MGIALIVLCLAPVDRLHVEGVTEDEGDAFAGTGIASRAKRKKEKPEEKTEISEIDAPPFSKELKKRWSYFIRKVYEPDLPVRPRRQARLFVLNARETCLP